MALACSIWRLRAASNKQPVGNTPAETETTVGEGICIHLVALWQKGQHFLERPTLFEKGSIFAKGLHLCGTLKRIRKIGIRISQEEARVAPLVFGEGEAVGAQVASQGRILEGVHVDLCASPLVANGSELGIVPKEDKLLGDELQSRQV